MSSVLTVVAQKGTLAAMRQIADVCLCGARSEAENGAVVALRRRQSLVLVGRQIAGRWGRVRVLHCCRRWCLVEHAD